MSALKCEEFVVGGERKLKQALALNLPRTSCFRSKVNGRNAP